MSVAIRRADRQLPIPGSEPAEQLQRTSPALAESAVGAAVQLTAQKLLPEPPRVPNAQVARGIGAIPE